MELMSSESRLLGGGDHITWTALHLVAQDDQNCWQPKADGTVSKRSVVGSSPHKPSPTAAASSSSLSTSSGSSSTTAAQSVAIQVKQLESFEQELDPLVLQTQCELDDDYEGGECFLSKCLALMLTGGVLVFLYHVVYPVYKQST